MTGDKSRRRNSPDVLNLTPQSYEGQLRRLLPGRGRTATHGRAIASRSPNEYGPTSEARSHVSTAAIAAPTPTEALDTFGATRHPRARPARRRRRRTSTSLGEVDRTSSSVRSALTSRPRSCALAAAASRMAKSASSPARSTLARRPAFSAAFVAASVDCHHSCLRPRNPVSDSVADASLRISWSVNERAARRISAEAWRPCCSSVTALILTLARHRLAQHRMPGRRPFSLCPPTTGTDARRP